jgi:hypothetical protein
VVGLLASDLLGGGGSVAFCHFIHIPVPARDVRTTKIIAISQMVANLASSVKSHW